MKHLTVWYLNKICILLARKKCGWTLWVSNKSVRYRYVDMRKSRKLSLREKHCFFFLISYFILLRERERESMSGVGRSGGEGQRERESQVWSPTWGLISHNPEIMT